MEDRQWEWEWAIVIRLWRYVSFRFRLPVTTVVNRIESSVVERKARTNKCEREKSGGKCLNHSRLPVVLWLFVLVNSTPLLCWKATSFRKHFTHQNTCALLLNRELSIPVACLVVINAWRVCMNAFPLVDNNKGKGLNQGDDNGQSPTDCQVGTVEISSQSSDCVFLISLV